MTFNRSVITRRRARAFFEWRADCLAEARANREAFITFKRRVGGWSAKISTSGGTVRARAGVEVYGLVLYRRYWAFYPP